MLSFDTFYEISYFEFIKTWELYGNEAAARAGQRPFLLPKDRVLQAD